jgi:hypothetical protein
VIQLDSPNKGESMNAKKRIIGHTSNKNTRQVNPNNFHNIHRVISKIAVGIVPRQILYLIRPPPIGLVAINISDLLGIDFFIKIFALYRSAFPVATGHFYL